VFIVFFRTTHGQLAAAAVDATEPGRNGAPARRRGRRGAAPRGEVPVTAAIGLKEAAASHAGHGSPELVSRGVQATVGLAVAVGAYGVAVGGLFALVFAASLGRVGALAARGRSAALALLAFTVVVLASPVSEVPGQPAAGRAGGHDRRATRPVLRVRRDLGDRVPPRGGGLGEVPDVAGRCGRRGRRLLSLGLAKK
jgi:hypothetical protein